MTSTRDDRPGLLALLDHLRPGDTLVVWKLDRIGRSVKGLIAFMEDLKDREVGFKSLHDNIDTATAMGQFFFIVMAALAQVERELLVERTQAGLAAARARGRRGGRKVKLTRPQQQLMMRELANPATHVGQLAELLGVDRSTLYRTKRRILARQQAQPQAAD